MLGMNRKHQAEFIGIRKEVIEKKFWPHAENKWRMETKNKRGVGKPD